MINRFFKRDICYRTKRLNQKLRAKAIQTANSVIGLSRHVSYARVKPTILARALTNKTIGPSNRQHNAGVQSSSGPQVDLLNALKSAAQEKHEKKKTDKLDDWLYGTLGDETTESITYLPAWSSHEHSSQR